MNKSKSSIRELTADELKAVSGGLIVITVGKTGVGSPGASGAGGGEAGGVGIGGSGSITFGL